MERDRLTHSYQDDVAEHHKPGLRNLLRTIGLDIDYERAAPGIQHASVDRIGGINELLARFIDFPGRYRFIRRRKTLLRRKFVSHFVIPFRQWTCPMRLFELLDPNRLLEGCKLRVVGRLHMQQ